MSVVSATLVIGSVVVSLDYFRQLAMRLMNVFGGEMKSYSMLLDRGRREALLRMKESAPDADFFCNVRLDSAALGGKSKNGKVTCIEITAYGTAIYLKK